MKSLWNEMSSAYRTRVALLVRQECPFAVWLLYRDMFYMGGEL